MRLFYSWQSDIPENTAIMRKVLQKICKELNIEYTEDTRDEAGGDLIIDVILKKIDNSTIFLGDLTIVGQDMNGDPLSNSNVCYELGYAEARLGRKNLIYVFNEEFGSYKRLPFDLGQRMVTRFKTVDRKIDSDDTKRLEGDIRKKITKITQTENIVKKLNLNTYERTILYWANTLSEGHVREYQPTSGHGRSSFLAPTRGAGPFSIAPRYGYFEGHDAKSNALFRKALGSLAEKDLVTDIKERNPFGTPKLHYVLTEEGEEAAGAIEESEVAQVIPYEEK